MLTLFLTTTRIVLVKFYFLFMFSISRETDYALNAVFYLADKRDYVSVFEISEKLLIPKNYLAKIFSKLASEKILKSREGKTGGYILNKKLEDISLYDFFSFFEKDLNIVKCCSDNKTCSCSGVCFHKNFFQNYLSKILQKELKEKNLADVFKYR